MQTLFIGKDRTNKPFQKHWQFCVGSGHAKMAMRSDYARQLKRAHEELGIDRVRFHGIFCDDMHTLPGFDEIIPFPGAEDIVEHSFYHCGVAIDNVLAAGVKPFVELSFMPDALAKEKNGGTGKMFYGANFSLPEDFDAWTEHVAQFVKYLIHRYGKEEVESWYFEVWNEPDLVGAFFKGTQEDYFRLYEVTARKLKEIDEKLQVGGPATSGSRWVDAFVAFCEGNQVPLDFVSTHQYAGDPLTGVKEPGAEEGTEDGFEKFEQLTQMSASLPRNLSHLQLMRMLMGDPSEEDGFPEGRFKDNAATVRKQAGVYPLFYTEWNFQAVLTCVHNDTRKASAYIVKTALDVEPLIQGSSIWTFSDIFEEMHQFTDEFHGGFGLQTIHGIPKPNFHALKMLEMLAANRIELGSDMTDKEIGVAAFEDDEKIQVLLFRQKMKQEDLPAEQIEVSVAMNLAAKEASLYRIDEMHCNPLKIFEEMGRPKDLTPAEVTEIERKSELVKELIDIQYDNGYAKFSVELFVNDIYLITIEKECIS